MIFGLVFLPLSDLFVSLDLSTLFLFVDIS